MKLVKVGAAALNQIPLGWDQNRRNILDAIAMARAEAVTVLALPEMAISGYGCEDAFLSTGVRELSFEILREVAAATSGMIVSVGLPVAYRHALYNAAALLVDGRIQGFVCKRHLAGDGIYYEPRWFKPWPGGVHAVLTQDGDPFPIGDLHFDCGGVRIGFEICEDAWVAKRPGGDLSLAAADIILNPSASHFAFGKSEVRKRIVLEGSRAFGVTYVYTNLLGNESGRIIYDGSVLIASGGRLVAIGPRLTFDDVVLTSAVVDLDQTRAAQSRSSAFVPTNTGDERLVAVPFTLPPQEPVFREPTQPAWESSAALKEEEFTRAVTLALFDYMRKSRSGGFVVSLSGGADSSAVACLVALMVRMAVGALGADAFRKKLAYLDSLLGDAMSPEEIIPRLLTTAYQSTANSGETTRAAARDVATALGATHHELDVEALVAGYVDLIANAIGRKLDWAQDDTVLQNIQARTRAPGVWMLANLRNALLLATSNRSEAAVGYATMDGDTCGGLSPIAGIDKAFLRRWLSWLETAGPEGCEPVPALAAVNRQAPTAELRPPAANQTDEDDLMPYAVLDVVERLAILDKHAPLEVYRLARARFPEHTSHDLALWVERFFRLWCRNQWKRERYAPSFHLDDESLDPKTWCRFPILSGGYERELAELKRHLARAAEAGGG